jgi:hypothetical protein
MNILNNNITVNFDKLLKSDRVRIAKIILYIQSFIESFKPDLYPPDTKDEISFIKLAKSLANEWTECWYKILEKNIDSLVLILDQFKPTRNIFDNFYNELYGQELEIKFVDIFEEVFYDHLSEIKVYSLIKQLLDNTFVARKITYSREINICESRFNIYNDIIYDIKIIDRSPKVKIISKLKISDFRKLNSIVSEVDIREEIIQQVEELERKYA